MSSIVERLRSHDATAIYNSSDEAADLLRQQAARIAELEAERDGLVKIIAKGLALAEAASNEDDDAMVELQFKGHAIKQLVELCRLQHEALKACQEYLQSDWTHSTAATNAIAAFNKFEGGK